MIIYLIKLDGLPPSTLYPNRLRNLHWAVRSEVVSLERNKSRLLCIQFMNDRDMMRPFHENAVLSFDFYSSDKRVRDLDGMISACKPWIDGIVDSGIIINDDCFHLEYGHVKYHLADKAETVLSVEVKHG